MTSLRNRIQIAVISVTLVVVLVTVLVVNDAVVRMVVRKENAHAQEVLDLAVMTIRDNHRNYAFHRQTLLDERRRGLRSIMDTAMGAVAHAHGLAARGALTVEQAQELALDTVRAMRYADGSGYIWVQDCAPSLPTMLMHPVIPEIEGEKPRDARYYKALDGETHLLEEFVARTGEGSAFVSYQWPKPTPAGLTEMVPKVSFVSRFEPWSWLLGTGLYIDDIETLCGEHRETMIEDTMELLAEVRLMESGYLYVFDSDGVMLLHPRLPSGENAMDVTNPATGVPVLAEIMAAARTPEERLRYPWNKPGHPEEVLFEKIAYVRYFEPLDWYIAASIYEDELYAPARRLSGRILGVAAVLLALAILVSLRLVRSIVRPLTVLAGYAHRMQTEGVESMDLREFQVRGPLEVETLARRLHQLVSSVRRQQQQLRATLDSIGDAVIATDADGCITRINPVAEALTGWPRAEAVGRPFAEVFRLIHDQTREPLEPPLPKVLEAGATVQCQEHAVLVARDGRERRIDDSGAPIRNHQGTIIGAVLVFRDITDKLALEETLRQSQKMEAVGRLAGGVAHDFNNMLGGILGAAELLEESVEADPDEAKELIAIIIDSVGRAAALAAQLLAFGRKQSMVSQSVSMHRIVSDTIDLLRHTIDRRITIETALRAEVCTVNGDAAQLQSVLLNLGINAAQAMPEGGTLRFETKVAELDGFYCRASEFDLTPGRYVDVAVRDTGRGIPVGILKRVFEPFFTTKSQGKGTGLGLAACYGTVRQHGGAITVYSEEGKGTCFHVALPLTEAEAESVPPKAPLSLGAGTILLVDDEAAMRVTGEGILRKWGYTVLLAEDGEEAVACYRAQGDAIDLVVCDMIMPKMNGRDCFFALRRIDPTVRFILASGFTQHEDTAEMRQHGLAGYIRKPFSADVLVRAVQDAMREG